ncbi:MAG TPA: IS630 transposase-related protein [Verrucomicrobiae bacterium]
MKRPISLDLRQRILVSYDQDEGTREEIAHRYRVSLGMVKKLLQQRRQTGDIACQYHRCGRRPDLGMEQRQKLRALVNRKPDLTLEELRQAAQLDCTIQAIHYALAAMGLTYKKRRSAPVNKTVRISAEPAATGAANSRRGIRRG